MDVELIAETNVKMPHVLERSKITYPSTHEKMKNNKKKEGRRKPVSLC